MRGPVLAVLLAAAGLALSACVAETIERRKPRKGPVKEVGYVDYGGGRVRYSTDGWGWFVAGRRRHARRLMRKNCGKDLVPVVTDEYLRQDADVAYAGDDASADIDRGVEHYKIAPFQHYAYECRPKGEKAVPAVAVSTGPVRAPFIVVPARDLLPVVSTAAVAAPEAPERAGGNLPIPVSTAPAVTEPRP